MASIDIKQLEEIVKQNMTDYREIELDEDNTGCYVVCNAITFSELTTLANILGTTDIEIGGTAEDYDLGDIVIYVLFKNIGDVNGKSVS